MKRKLPPFAAVRAFEAAARHRSFKAAAEELSVTQSSISHQVKGLETFLGASLFHRRASGIELTRRGAEYFGDVTGILDRLDESTARFTGVEPGGPLAVRATPAFASRWMLPRLERFNAAYPEIELEVTTTTNPMTFPGEGVDVLIQYGQAPMEGLRVDPFLQSSRFPVCSPKLLEQAERPRAPADLLRFTLLRDVVGDEWENWFAAARAVAPGRIRGPRFAHCELTHRAAEEGQGVVLAYGALIDRELADGSLVKLFDVETPPKVIYSLTCPEGWVNRPRVAAFRNWVFEEVRGSAAALRH
jgi:LysR family glycine cleavage system transcriptional activator